MQAVTEPHPSNSCQSNTRTESRGMGKKSTKILPELHKYDYTKEEKKKGRLGFPKRLKQPSDSFSQLSRCDYVSEGCSVSSAHGAQARSARSVIHRSSWREESSDIQIIAAFPWISLPFSGLLELKSSTTAFLITSARHGNFVTQNPNALFWWDGDPRACPAYHGPI